MNKEYQSDKLLEELVDNYEDIYGEGFIKAEHPETGRMAWIKIDGNRRISLYKKNDRVVHVEFLDLSVF
jgi:hypothetical protein